MRLNYVVLKSLLSEEISQFTLFNLSGIGFGLGWFRLAISWFFLNLINFSFFLWRLFSLLLIILNIQLWHLLGGRIDPAQLRILLGLIILFHLKYLVLLINMIKCSFEYDHRFTVKISKSNILQIFVLLLALLNSKQLSLLKHNLCTEWLWEAKDTWWNGRKGDTFAF